MARHQRGYDKRPAFNATASTRHQGGTNLQLIAMHGFHNIVIGHFLP